MLENVFDMKMKKIRIEQQLRGSLKKKPFGKEMDDDWIQEYVSQIQEGKEDKKLIEQMFRELKLYAQKMDDF